MKDRVFATLSSLTLLTAAAAFAQSSDRTESVVPVCVNHGNENPVVFAQAEILAGKMFRTAGVKIEWCNGSRSCLDRSGAIIVKLADASQAEFSTGALGRARPYEGTQIEVVFDLVKSATRSTQPTLLAHILVHEITHILQGISRHSATGVMKANWSETDYYAMLRRALPFTEVDIALIHTGLDKRESRMAAAPAAVASKQ